VQTVCRRLRRLILRLRSEPGIYPLRRKGRAATEHAGLLSAVAFGDWVRRRSSASLTGEIEQWIEVGVMGRFFHPKQRAFC
jgi:hypothetical protein